MLPQLFRKYDLRGIVGQEFVIERTRYLAYAITTYFKQIDPHISNVAVGMDGRIHSPHIKEELCRGLRDSGLNVTFIGTCSTPVLCFAHEILPVQATVMITASHNPKEYNGLKIAVGKRALFGPDIERIKDIYFSMSNPELALVPGAYQEENINDRYIDWFVNRFAHLKGAHFNVFIDCANGATGTIMPNLVQAMGWSGVSVIFANVDGNFPSHEADPTKESNLVELKHAINNKPGSFGMGLDGDGDRMAAVTNTQITVRGDELGAIFCHYLHQRGMHTPAIFDVKCSQAILNQLHDWQIPYHLTPCGQGYIKQAMDKYQAQFGAELSCHFCFRDRHFGYDDGVYALFQLLEIIYKTGFSFDELHKQLPTSYSTPDIRLVCREENKQRVIDNILAQLVNRRGIELITIDGIRAQYRHGCVTIRASNTEPVLSVRFEGISKYDLAGLIDEFFVLLSPHFDDTYLSHLLKGA